MTIAGFITWIYPGAYRRRILCAHGQTGISMPIVFADRLLVAIQLLTTFIFLNLIATPAWSQQQEFVCDVAGSNSSGSASADDQTPFAYQFESGARWSLCWHIDEKAGLILTNVGYAAPQEPLRQVMRQASIGQILFQYDQDTTATPLVSEIGLGGARILRDGPAQCDDGQLQSCLLYTSPSPRDLSTSRMPSSA